MPFSSSSHWHSFFAGMDSTGHLLNEEAHWGLLLGKDK